MRTTLAFILAPLIPAAVAVRDAGLLVAVVLAYLWTLLFGVPTFFVLRKLKRERHWIYGIAGFFLGAGFTIVQGAVSTGEARLAALVGVLGATTALAFSVIRGPERKNAEPVARANAARCHGLCMRTARAIERRGSSVTLAKKMKSLLLCLSALFGILGFAHAADVGETVVARIVVKGDGSLFFDGKKAEVRELDALLTPIKEKKGVVWYYRANPESDPHPVAMEVLKAIVGKKLPIKLFSKEDFSEFIGADGKPHKQKTG